MAQQTEAIEYIRQRYRKQEKDGRVSYKPYGSPKGVLLAKVVDGNKVKFGWSLCHKRKDHFDHVFGIMIAEGRLIRDSKVPLGILKQFQRFIDRWTKYFADKEIISSLKIDSHLENYDDEQRTVITGCELVHG